MVTITYHLRSPPGALSIASKHFLKWKMPSFLLHLNPRDSMQIVRHKTQHGPPLTATTYIPYPQRHYLLTPSPQATTTKNN